MTAGAEQIVYVLMQWNSHDGPDTVRVIADGDEAEQWKRGDLAGRAVVRCAVDGPEERTHV